MQHGLAEEDVEVDEEVMKEVVQGYTQEAGVRWNYFLHIAMSPVINCRTLERQLGALCRAVAVSLAEKGKVGNLEREREKWNEIGIRDFMKRTSNVCTPQENAKKMHNIDIQFVEKVCILVVTCCLICESKGNPKLD